MEITCKVNIPDARGMDSVKMPKFDIKDSYSSYWLIQIANKLIGMEKEATWVYETIQAYTAPWIVRPVWQEELRKESRRLARAVSESSINMRTVR